MLRYLRKCMKKFNIIEWIKMLLHKLRHEYAKRRVFKTAMANALYLHYDWCYMIHSELCSACGGPLQLGVGLVYIPISRLLHLQNRTLQNFIYWRQVIATTVTKIKYIHLDRSGFVSFVPHLTKLLSRLKQWHYSTYHTIIFITL